MSLYNFTFIIQRIREPFVPLADRLFRFMSEQQVLPVHSMPDLPPGQEPIQIEQRRLDIYLTCTVEAQDRADAHHKLNQLADRIQTEVCERSGPFVEVAGFVSTEPLLMQLDQVLQGPVCTFAVYRTGAVYALQGDERISDLEDPYSPLFGDGGLYKLSAAETRQVLNSRQHTLVWSRRGSLRKHFHQNHSDSWYAQHA